MLLFIIHSELSHPDTWQDLINAFSLYLEVFFFKKGFLLLVTFFKAFKKSN